MKNCGIDLHSNNSVVIVSEVKDRIVRVLRSTAGSSRQHRPDFRLSQHSRTSPSSFREQ